MRFDLAAKRRLLFIVSVLAFSISLFIVTGPSDYYYYNVNEVTGNLLNGEWRKLTEDEKNNLSTLGRILFLDEPIPKIKESTQYKILIWKYGKTIENRHLKHFTKHKFDPFVHCSVRNCEISYEDSDIATADLVIFHLHRMKGVSDLPKTSRSSKQIWAFLTDESPFHTFLDGKSKLVDFKGVFNWSMTYRMDSDIPVPYGRTIPLNQPQKIKDKPWKSKRRDVLIAIMGSNCGGNNHRWQYVKELQKYITVHVYGKCGTMKCPGHFKEDCPDISNYLFYLAFENSNCREYITEKLWWNAYTKNSIPVVMGGYHKDYEKLLPPNSYIQVTDFARPADLAEYIHYINSTGEFVRYFDWISRFKVVNEHGYFQSESFHYCRACEALNYNKKSNKIYNDLRQFWDTSRDCTIAWDNT